MGTRRAGDLEFANRSNIILFEVENDGSGSVRKFNEFPCLNAGQTVKTGYTVPDLKHGANFLQLALRLVSGELFPEDCGDFVRLQL